MMEAAVVSCFLGEMMEKQVWKITARYALVQGGYWMCFCMIASYASVYLLGQGFNNTEIGLLIGMSGAVSAVLQPWIGGIVDRSRKVTLKGLITFFSAAVVVLAAILLLTSRKTVVTIGYGAMYAALQVLLPLVYSLGMESINQGSPLNFGAARSGGSLIYAVTTYITGILTAKSGAFVIPAMGAVFGLFLAVSAWCFPLAPKTVKEKENGQKQTVSEQGFFGRYPRYLLLVAGCILIFVSHGIINNFQFQIIESKGGDSSSMGVALAIAALSEIPTMFLFGELVKRRKSSFWLKLSSIFFVVKSLGTLVCPNVAGLYLVSALQMLGYALFTVSSVYYVNTIMDEHDRVKGQSYMTMTNTIGMVIGSFLGGPLIDCFGVWAMLGMSTVLAAIGMVIILRSVEKGV